MIVLIMITLMIVIMITILIMIMITMIMMILIIAIYIYIYIHTHAYIRVLPAPCPAWVLQQLLQDSSKGGAVETGAEVYLITCNDNHNMKNNKKTNITSNHTNKRRCSGNSA